MSPHTVVCTLALALGASACGKEKLQAMRGKPGGAITGRICDRSVGAWISNASVSVQGQSHLATQTDADGFFTLEGLKPGEYVLDVSSATYTGVRVGLVESNATTDIGVTNCAPETGTINGRVCDEGTEAWLEGATVTVSTTLGDHSTTTDAFGRFAFENIPVGNHTITVDSGKTFSALVQASSTVTVGDLGCGPAGDLHGRICGGAGYWLSHAEVAITLEDQTVVSTHTDPDGYFTLQDIPVGAHTVSVTKGAFSTTFEATILGDVVVELGEPVCIPPSNNIAVITGNYDSVQDILVDLGFPIRSVDNGNGPSQQNAAGNIDIINSWNAQNWVDDFLGDPSRLAQYDLIFFNCGLDDYDLHDNSQQAQDALNNLAVYVQNGGSVYASDWAGDLIRMAFPNRLNFYGDDTEFGEGRVGVYTANETGIIVDGSLLNALQRTTVSINYNYDAWVSLEPLDAQPNDVRIWVKGDVTIAVDFGTDQPLNNVPLLAQFSYGAGRVLFTTFHNESQLTQDMEDVLNFIVFEL